jgi:anti-sigma regulatory factor (Ser/Thr protein kinase)
MMFVQAAVTASVRSSTSGSDQTGGRGLWLANQLCDLVELRSGPVETVVRLHMRLS